MLNTLQSLAADIQVAVASNFAEVMHHIVDRFEASSGYRVALSAGSTGKQYAQIKQGAPFDLFFAADTKRPALLEQSGLAVAGSRFTYAVGKMVLWSAKKNYIDAEGQDLTKFDFKHLAIANPAFAPYGRAAREILQALGLWQNIHHRLVRGENIAQTFQFVKSGNAELGFVALSQVKQVRQLEQPTYWLVPQVLYQPIKQQAVLLNNNKAARCFWAFMQSDPVLQLIRDYGYDTL